jgi:glycine cleavage system transcriptional repressor
MLRALHLARSSAPIVSAASLASATAAAASSTAVQRRLMAAAASSAAAPDAFSSPRARAVVLSLAGSDAPGIVGRFSRTALSHGANVEETRMARLGGEFAIIGMLSVPATADLDQVGKAFEEAFPGFSVHCRPTVPDDATDSRLAAGVAPQVWSVELEGPDSLGIVASVTEALARGGANIHELETETVQAPFAGYSLFKLRTSFTIAPDAVDKLASAMAVVESEFGVGIAMTMDDTAESSTASNGSSQG